jgi:tRNA threonylcarbamoyl adenosine modification protein (Sua5/YciO/YrdC/YwlC family)
LKKAPIIKINPRRILRAKIALAAGMILKGGVVAYPTETVYGLGANALDKKAVSRVFDIKGRSSDKPLIVLVRNRRQLRALVSEVTPLARALMDRFWPDGLTLVLEASPEVPKGVLGGGTSIALRLSGNRVVQALLDLVRVPITAPSANLAGHSAPLTAEDVQEQLGNRVDLVLDGGKAPLAVPSTILDVRGEPATVLRHGRVPLRDIRRVVAVHDPRGEDSLERIHILLVCTGNTCRSAMAGEYLTKLLSDKGVTHIKVLSAGTHAGKGDAASHLAQEVAKRESGVDLSGHRARRLTRDLLEESDLILAMTLSHARHIERMGRKFARRTYLLTSYLRDDGTFQDIEDPMGGSRRDYQRAFGLISKELERILPVLITAPLGRKH